MFRAIGGYNQRYKICHRLHEETKQGMKVFRGICPTDWTENITFYGGAENPIPRSLKLIHYETKSGNSSRLSRFPLSPDDIKQHITRTLPSVYIPDECK